MRNSQFRVFEEATENIKKIITNIEVQIGPYGSKLNDPTVARAIGPAIVKGLYDAAEEVLRVICAIKSTPNGVLKWPKVKDLIKHGACVDAPADVRIAASGMAGIRKDCDKGDMTPDDLAVMFHAFIIFIEWAMHEIIEAGKEGELFIAIRDLERIVKNIFEPLESYRDPMRYR